MYPTSFLLIVYLLSWCSVTLGKEKKEPLDLLPGSLNPADWSIITLQDPDPSTYDAESTTAHDEPSSDQCEKLLASYDPMRHLLDPGRIEYVSADARRASPLELQLAACQRIRQAARRAGPPQHRAAKDIRAGSKEYDLPSREYEFGSIEYYDELTKVDLDRGCPVVVMVVKMHIPAMRPFDYECLHISRLFVLEKFRGYSKMNFKEGLE